MERGRPHGRTSVGYRIEGAKSDKKPDMRSKRDQGQLQWTLMFLVALTMQPQAVCAVGMFELQISHFQNPHGLLQSGECCDLQPSGGQRCSLRDQCDTFFQACLKEYQARVVPTGACTFGSGSTGILGGNSQTLHPRGHDGGGDGRGGEGDRSNGHIVIPFRYAWPKSFSLVLEALDFDNDTAKSGQLIDRVLLSSMLNPGDQWQTRRHHSYTLSLEYRLRFRCDTNYFGPHCNKFCRARHDFFGHFGCDPSGTKVCTEGWTGPECSNAVCRQGCHQIHGSCSLPGECECNYGWQGALCDQCVTFPGCVYGSCTEPWQCVCDVNWGGLLCDKDLNYCGTHQPCKNGGTCSNTEPNEYQCECQDGFGGRNCDIVERACVSSPCKNGATCVEDSADFRCICPSGWTGHVCANVVRQCDLRPCGRGATCQETKEGHRCLCPPGWSGRTCQLDADECEMGVCVHARSCRNLIGGYLCDCLPGWTGSNCDIKNSSCQGLCLNGGHCEDLVSGSRCLCLPEFSGKYCQTVSSLCDSDPCLNGGQCVVASERKATCSCPMGYSGLFCEVVLDPCNPNPCQQGMVCHGTEGRYMCACPEGYYGTECLSRKDSCAGHNCQGAMTDSARMSFYMVLVAVSVLLTVCACTACAFVLSHVQRQKHRAAPQDEGINNQREFVTLIHNVERPAPPPVSANALAPVSHCHEEIELTLPPAPANASPALKPARAPKLDISNLEREKLNRFHYVENQELEA